MTVTNTHTDDTNDSSRNVSWSNKLTTPARKWKPYQSLLRRRNGYRIDSQHYIQPLNARSISMSKVTKVAKNRNTPLNQDEFNQSRNQLTLDTVTSEWIKDMIQRGKDILNKSRLKEQKIIHNRFKRYEEQQIMDNHALDGSSFERLGNYHRVNETGSGGDGDTNNDKLHIIEINEKQDDEDPSIGSQQEREEEAFQGTDEEEQDNEQSINNFDNEVNEDSEPSIIILTSEDEEKQDQENSQHSNNDNKSDNDLASYTSHSSDVEEEEEEEEEEKLDLLNIDKEYNNDLFGEYESDKSNFYGQNEEDHENESYEEQEGDDEEEERENEVIEEEEEEEEDEEAYDSDDNHYENMTVDFQKYMIPRNHTFNQNNNPSLNTFMSNAYNDPSKVNNINQHDTNLQVESASNDAVSGEYYESNTEEGISEQSQQEYEMSLEEDDYSFSTKDVADRQDIENQEDNYEEEEVVNDRYNGYLLPDEGSIEQESNAEEESESDETNNISIEDFSTDDGQEQGSLNRNSLEDSNSIYDEQVTSEEHEYDENLESDTLKSTQSLKNIAKNAISQIYAHLGDQPLTENFDSDREVSVDAQSKSDNNEEDGKESLHIVVQNVEIPEHKDDVSVLQQTQNIIPLENEHKEINEEAFDEQEIVENEEDKYKKEMEDNKISSKNDLSIYHSINNESDQSVSTEIEVPSINTNMKNTDQYEITISNSVYSNTSVDTDNREIFPLNVTYISPFSDDPFASAEVDETSKLKLQETLALLNKTDKHEDKLESDSENRDHDNRLPKVDKENDKIVDNIDEEILKEDSVQISKQPIRESSQYDVINHEYNVIIENKIWNNDSRADTRVEPMNLGQQNTNIDKNNNSSHLLDTERDPINLNIESFEPTNVKECNSGKINSKATVLQYEHSKVGIYEKNEISKVIHDDVDNKALSSSKELPDMKAKVISNPQNEKHEIVEKNLDSCVTLNKNEALQSGEVNLAPSIQQGEPLLEKGETAYVTNNKGENVTVTLAPESVTPTFGVTDTENVNMNLGLEEQSNIDRTSILESHEVKDDITIKHEDYNTKVLFETTNLNQPSVVEKIISSPIKAINALSVSVQKISNVANKFVEILDTGYSSDENESIIEIHSSSSVEEIDENEVNQGKQGVQSQFDTSIVHNMIDIEQESTDSKEVKDMNDHKAEVNKNLSNNRAVDCNTNRMLVQNDNIDKSDRSSTTYGINSSLSASAKNQNKSDISSEAYDIEEHNIGEVNGNAIDNLQDVLHKSTTEELQQYIADEQTHESGSIINDNEEEEITPCVINSPLIQSADLHAASKLFELAKEIDENTTAITKDQITKQTDGLDDCNLEVNTNNQIQVIEKDEKSELEDYPINNTLEDISRIGTGSSSSIIASTTITAAPQESLELIHKDTERLHDNKHTENKSIDEVSPQLEISNELPSDPPSDDDNANHDESKVGHEEDEHNTTVKEGEADSDNEKPDVMTVYISISESEDQENENIPVQNHQNEKTSHNHTELPENNISVGVSRANHAENSNVEPKNIHSILPEGNAVQLTCNNTNTSFEKPVSPELTHDEPKKQENIDKNKRKQKQKSSRHRKKRKLPITGSHMTSPGRPHRNESNRNNNKNDSNSNSNNRNSANNQYKNKKFKQDGSNHATKKFK